MTTAKNSRGLSPASGAAIFSPVPGMAHIPDATTQHIGAAKDVAPPRAAAPDDGGAPSSIFARQIRMAYGLLQTAIEEATEAAECSNAKIAGELEDLQARAIRSIHDSALATIDLFEAIGAAQTPGELANRQMELARRQREIR